MLSMNLKKFGAVKFKVVGVYIELVNRKYDKTKDRKSLVYEDDVVRVESFGIIGIDNNGKDMNDDSDLLALPCPPYCSNNPTNYNMITLFEILSMNEVYEQERLLLN